MDMVLRRDLRTILILDMLSCVITRLCVRGFYALYTELHFLVCSQSFPFESSPSTQNALKVTSGSLLSLSKTNSAVAPTK